MSLINDALKRAKQAQSENALVVSDAPAPLRPVESPAREQDANWWIWPVAILLFLVLFAGLFFVLSSTLNATKPMAAAPVAAPSSESHIAAAPVAELSKPPVVAIEEVKAPKPVRIQGIVYDPVNPWAIIGGKTIRVGDSVDGMRVTAISRDAIMLAGNGQTTQLHVGDK